MLTNELSFEQGPIRPPNEARSFLLRITRNCPWNRCRFCLVYKTEKFSIRTIEEVKKDITTARQIADDIKAMSSKLGGKGEINDQVVSHIYGNSSYSQSYRSIAAWLYYETGACFLQDGDNLVMKNRELIEILGFLRETFPEIKRVTTYARSRTIVRKSVEGLKQIKEAGLDRVHVGLETGYDPLLKFIKKGVSAAQQVDAGRKIVEAGIELSEYIMPGLGGQEMWKEHAVETANVLNQINPNFIRLRSLKVPPVIPLYENVKDGSFTELTDDMFVEEIGLFISSLDNITSTVTSDHMNNLLEEVTGTLPEDKEAMLEVVRKYQALSDQDRLIYRAGRRGNAFRSIDDLERDRVTYDKISNLISEVRAKDGEEGVDKFINQLGNMYM